MIPFHPLFVHFPIALIFTATFFSLLSFIVKDKKKIFKEIFFWNMLVGTISAIFTVISGIIAENNLVHNNAIHEIMEVHQLLGAILTIIFILITVWLITKKSKIKTKGQIIITIILIIASGFLGYTANLGGEMVYEQGAGIIPMENMIQNTPHTHSNNDIYNNTNLSH